MKKRPYINVYVSTHIHIYDQIHIGMYVCISLMGKGGDQVCASG